MEARRLAILSSHLCPLGSGQPRGRTPIPLFSALSFSDCASGSGETQRFRDSEKEDQHNDCVFCKIVRGESPALKAFSYHPKISFLFLKSHSTTCDSCNVFESAVYQQCNNESYRLWAFALPLDQKSTCTQELYMMLDHSIALLKYLHNCKRNIVSLRNVSTHIHIIPRKARDCLWPSESLRRHPLKLDQNTFKLVNCVQEELLPVGNTKDGNDQGSALAKNLSS